MLLPLPQLLLVLPLHTHYQLQIRGTHCASPEVQLLMVLAPSLLLGERHQQQLPPLLQQLH